MTGIIIQFSDYFIIGSHLYHNHGRNNDANNQGIVFQFTQQFIITALAMKNISLHSWFLEGAQQTKKVEWTSSGDGIDFEKKIVLKMD